ncbi:MAG: F0F1 ATP synthase subunit alpha, partial [Corynebacterium kroppenstedtii]|nr:F0F1 ATP synthase subunit alpha [Corynebacterium kroppenstedtii]
DLEAFAAFASDLDDSSKAQLERGSRLVELLKQPENHPQAVEDQMVSIYLAGNGDFDSVPVEDIRRFESELLEHLHSKHAGVFEQFEGGSPLNDESKAELSSAVDEFKQNFQASDGKPVINEPDVDPMEQSELGKEQIAVSRKSSGK